MTAPQPHLHLVARNSNLVELVGLPGSGKTTLLRQITGRGERFHDQHTLLQQAASARLRSASIKGYLLAHISGARYAKHRYLSSDVHARRFLRHNSGLADLLSEWMAELPFNGGIQYLGRMVTLSHVLSVASLIDHISQPQIILFDEHWLQFLLVVLNDGDDARYLGWLKKVLPLVRLPGYAIMLTGASQVAAARQKQRKKLATLMDGPFDTVMRGEQMEIRMLQAAGVLQASGIQVLKLDANTPIDENGRAARRWLEAQLGV